MFDFKLPPIHIHVHQGDLHLSTPGTYQIETQNHGGEGLSAEKLQVLYDYLRDALGIPRAPTQSPVPPVEFGKWGDVFVQPYYESERLFDELRADTVQQALIDNPAQALCTFLRDPSSLAEDFVQLDSITRDPATGGLVLRGEKFSLRIAANCFDLIKVDYDPPGAPETPDDGTDYMQLLRHPSVALVRGLAEGTYLMRPAAVSSTRFGGMD